MPTYGNRHAVFVDLDHREDSLVVKARESVVTFTGVFYCRLFGFIPFSFYMPSLVFKRQELLEVLRSPDASTLKYEGFQPGQITIDQHQDGLDRLITIDFPIDSSSNFFSSHNQIHLRADSLFQLLQW